jgi:hypothetical protein
MESKNLVQVVSPSIYPKAIKQDLYSTDDFLIVLSDSILTKYEEQLLEKARFICTFKNNKYYRLSYNSLFDPADRILKQFIAEEGNLFKVNGMYCSSEDHLVYNSGFEHRTDVNALIGKGAFSGVKKGENTFADFEPGTFKEGGDYEVSVWMKNEQENALNEWLRFMVDEYDSENDVHHHTMVFPEQSEVVFGSWSLVELTFRVRNTGNKVSVITMGKKLSKANLHADELLIREKNVDVYKKADFQGKTVLLYNNHILVK